jgi:hypothetical protein
MHGTDALARTAHHQSLPNLGRVRRTLANSGEQVELTRSGELRPAHFGAPLPRSGKRVDPPDLGFCQLSRPECPDWRGGDGVDRLLTG